MRDGDGGACGGVHGGATCDAAPGERTEQMLYFEAGERTIWGGRARERWRKAGGGEQAVARVRVTRFWRGRGEDHFAAQLEFFSRQAFTALITLYYNRVISLSVRETS